MLVDTSVWIDHLRNGNRRLAFLLEAGEVECHPFVIGEIACGTLERREEILTLLAALPKVPEASHEEALVLVESKTLMGRGLGWVDVNLLSSTLLGRTLLWTLDRRLKAASREIGVAYDPAGPTAPGSP